MAIIPKQKNVQALNAIATSIMDGEDRTILPVNLGSVSAGMENTVDIPRTHAYSKLILQTEMTIAEMRAKLENIKVRLDAEDVIDVSANEYLNELEAEGYELQDYQLPIVFSLIVNGRTTGDEDLTTLGTLGLKQFQVTIRPAVGATNIAFYDIEAIIYPNFEAVAFFTLKSENFSALSAGNNRKTIEMDSADGHLVNIRLYDPAGDIEDISFKYRGIEKLDRVTPAGFEDMRKNQVIVKPAIAGVVSVDFMQASRPAGILRAEGGKANINVNLKAGATTTQMTYTEKRAIAL